MLSQTYFETARGISSVEVQPGYSLIVVRGTGEAGEKLVEALETLERGGFSVDFLKLGRAEFSFLVREESQQKVVEVLNAKGFDASHHRSKAIITVDAPNIRDESGLVARIAEIVIDSGGIIYCVGDMHCSVLVVVQTEKSEAVAVALRDCIGRVDIL